MGGFLVIVCAVLFYFLPATIAGLRRHHSDLAIFVLNLLLGWTVIGWIIALIWSFTGSATRVVVQSVAAPPPTVSPAGYCPHCGGARAAGPFCPGCGAKLS